MCPGGGVIQAPIASPCPVEGCGLCQLSCPRASTQSSGMGFGQSQDKLGCCSHPAAPVPIPAIASSLGPAMAGKGRARLRFQPSSPLIPAAWCNPPQRAQRQVPAGNWLWLWLWGLCREAEPEGKESWRLRRAVAGGDSTLLHLGAGRAQVGTWPSWCLEWGGQSPEFCCELGWDHPRGRGWGAVGCQSCPGAGKELPRVPQLEMSLSWCRWRWGGIQGISGEMNQWVTLQPGAEIAPLPVGLFPSASMKDLSHCPSPSREGCPWKNGVEGSHGCCPHGTPWCPPNCDCANAQLTPVPGLQELGRMAAPILHPSLCPGWKRERSS